MTEQEKATRLSDILSELKKVLDQEGQIDAIRYEVASLSQRETGVEAMAYMTVADFLQLRDGYVSESYANSIEEEADRVSRARGIGTGAIYVGGARRYVYRYSIIKEVCDKR